MTTIVEADSSAADALASAAGEQTNVVASLDVLRRHLEEHPNEYAIVLGPSVDLSAGVALADTLRVTRPTLGVILVRRRVDTTVLAEALRSGMREVVEERDLTGLNTAIVRAYELHVALTERSDEAGETSPKGTLITVFSAKGGVGKTTVSTNLAAALANGGKKQVCIVDLDLAFGDVAIVLQLFPAHTIADAVSMQNKLDPAAVAALLTRHSPGLSALVAPVQPDAKDRIHGDLIGRILRILKEQFDYVVVDTPPAFDDVVLQAFDESALVLLVGTLDVPSLKSLKITIETLTLLNHPRSHWRLVLNRADMKVGLSTHEVAKTLDMEIAAAIPQSQDVPASVNRGEALVLSSPRHAVSQTIIRLAADLAAAAPSHEQPQHSAAKHSDKRSLLRRKGRDR